MIKISIIYSKHAFIIIDTKWPNDYIKNVIQNTMPNYIIYDFDFNDKVNNSIFNKPINIY